MKLITENDLENLQRIKKFIDVADKTNETGIDWDNVELQETIKRIEYNLINGANYFKPVPEEDTVNYDSVCKTCGWEGSSEYLLGGGAIGDTGDYDDCYCPICGSADLD